MYYEVRSPDGRLLFQSLAEELSVKFAQDFYKSDKIICEIQEIAHQPKFHDCRESN
jgi:hypothetical protein